MMAYIKYCEVACLNCLGQMEELEHEKGRIVYECLECGKLASLQYSIRTYPRQKIKVD